MVNHSLDHSASVLVLAEHDEVLLDLRDEFLEGLRRVISTHVNQDFLNHVITVEVDRAV